MIKISGNIFKVKKDFILLLFSFSFFIICNSTQLFAGDSNMKSKEPIGDTIEFAGRKWITKDSNGKHTGPGNNYFNGNRENVYLDEQGKLHLRVTYRNDKWYCPEVRLSESLGYGRYYFYMDPLPQPIDKDVVIGVFLYDREDTSNYHKEIDIEFSKWGKDSSLNSQYVIQPKESEAFRFETDFSLSGFHLIELRKSKVVFKSFYNENDSINKTKAYSKYKITPDYNYLTKDEKVSLNVWLYHTVEPASLQEFEVIFSGFEFKPFWKDRIFRKKSAE